MNQQEIADYTDQLVEFCGLQSHIRFSTKVTGVEYLSEGNWQINTLDMLSGEAGSSYNATHVVSANGPLSTPRMPEVAGMARFKVKAFTAQWDYGVDLKGKTLAS